MTVSYLRRSRHQLWSDLLVALGGEEAFLTRHLTEKQMLLEILQIYGSPITTKRVNGFNALLEAVVIAAGGSASHLRQTKSEMLGALVTALGGTPPSVLYSSLTELLAACVNAADTGGGYVAKAVHSDGTVEMLLSSFAGVDSPYISFSFWFRILTATPTNNFLPFCFDPDNYGTYPNIGTNNQTIGINATDTALAKFFFQDTDPASPIVLTDTWINFLGSIDCNHPAHQKIGQMYLNDIDSFPFDARTLSGTPDQDIPFSMGFNGKKFVIPDLLTNADGLIGDMADLWIAPGQFIDFSVEANRRKFISAAGKPVDLGSDGSTPTGAAPAFVFSGDATEWLARAAGYGFTLTGSLTNATTSPSD